MTNSISKWWSSRNASVNVLFNVFQKQDRKNKGKKKKKESKSLRTALLFRISDPLLF